MESSATDSGRRPAADAATAPEGRLHTQPTQQGAIYLWTLAIFAGVMWFHNENLLFLLGTLAIGCGLTAWFLARRNLTGIVVQRDLPQRTRVGAPTTLAWRLRMRGRRAAVGVELEDRPARGLRPHCLQVDVPMVPAEGEVRCETQVKFGRRGLVEFGTDALEVASRWPIGLFRAETFVHVRGRIMVRPREGRITKRLRARLRGRAEIDARRPQVWSGDDVIYGVREYREGDDPRRIHWRTTARRGATVVSEWRSEQGHETLIVLGLGLGAGRPAQAAFERAVSCAATIWRACSRERLHARLVIGDGHDHTMGASGQGLERGLDALAVVQGRDRRSPRDTVRKLADPSASRRTILYIGTGIEAGLEAELKAAAGRAGSFLHLRADLRSVLRWVRGVAR